MTSHQLSSAARWGEPPWRLEARAQAQPLPSRVDVAIVGGGFTGLAVAAWLGRLEPSLRVALFEAGRLGAGASGRTGGIVLDETAVGELPGLDSVLEGFERALNELEIECDFERTQVWEIARRDTWQESPLAWQDSGLLRVAEEVPGGTVDPGRLLAGLARAAQDCGAQLHEHTRVQRLELQSPLRSRLAQDEVRAELVLLAVNGSGINLLPWALGERAKFTTALATGPLRPDQLRALGLLPPRPFYTLDLPYLWGRGLGRHRLIFGGGLVQVASAAELAALDIRHGEASRRMASLEKRVQGLHPALRQVQFSHRWGGPILFGPGGRPFFCRHPQCAQVLLLGGYAGQGIALSVYLARWAAEALLGRRDPPAWGEP